MNIRLLDYFRLIDFPNRTTKEQVKYLLFFVTIVAGLRKDMTARIIAQRLNDQDTDVREEEVAEILSKDKRHFAVSPYEDKRDRLPGEVPYIITESEKKTLIKEANIRFAKINSWKKPSNIFFSFVIAACLGTLLAVIAWHLSTNTGVDDLSWTQFKKRLRMTEISMEERAKYFLYFITEHIKLRQDMTPNVISDRLHDANLGTIAPSAVEAYFRSHPHEVVSSTSRAGAYKIATEEADRIKSLLGLKLPPEGDSISLSWIASHVHVSGIVAFLAGCSLVLASCVGIGHYTGKLAKMDKEQLLLGEES